MDLDLRKYHINSVNELVSFLELFEARVPEIIRQVKKMQMQNASLENVVANERKKRQNLSQGIVVNNNVPANSIPVDKERDEREASAEQARLAQMRAASENATKTFGTHPKAQVTAGEVGQLAQRLKQEQATTKVTTTNGAVEDMPYDTIDDFSPLEGLEENAQPENTQANQETPGESIEQTQTTGSEIKKDLQPKVEEPKTAAPKRQGLKKNVKK